MRSLRFAHRVLSAATLSLGLVASATVAAAGTTTVNAPSYGGELSVSDILSGVYGEAFSASGDNFTSTSFSAIRIDDFGIGGPLSTTGAQGSADDKVWDGEFAKASARGRYAGYDQSFGYIDGASGGIYHNLFDTVGYGLSPSVTGEAVDINAIGQFRLARNGQNGVFSSLETDNLDGLDHMVTYQIQGLADASNFVTWMVFFEDLNMIQGGEHAQWSDRDFNDLAVELKAAAVPLPPAALMGLVGLAVPMGMNVAKRYRRKA